jgi:CxxC-x17-CxxC domain-containing protein
MGNFNRDRGGDRRGGGGYNDRRGGGGFNRGGGGSSMHKAVCSDCGNDCEVPFRPTGSKPVFCSSCFEKQGGGSRDRGGDRDRRPRFDNKSSDNSKDILKGIKTLNYKLDELIKALAGETTVEKTEATPKKVAKKAAKKTTKKAVAKKPAKKKAVAKKKVDKKKK